MRPRLLKLLLVAGVFFGTAGAAYAAVVACYGITYATTASDSATVKAVSATCQSNWLVTGGGGKVVGGSPEAVLRGTWPTSPRTWGAAGHEVDPTYANWYVEARAVCASLTSMHGYQLVRTSTSTDVAPGVKFTGVNCPTGKKAIGGGAEIEGTTEAALRTTRPRAGLVGWEAAATTTDGAPFAWTLDVWAVCVNSSIFPDAAVHTMSTASDTTSTKTLAVTCPGSKRPLSGGADIGGGSPNQGAANWDEALTATAPTFDWSRRWFATAVTEDAHTTPWSLQVYVVCATVPY